MAMLSPTTDQRHFYWDVNGWGGRAVFPGPLDWFVAALLAMTTGRTRHSSYPAHAGYSVNRGFSILTPASLDTGSPAFAGDPVCGSRSGLAPARNPASATAAVIHHDKIHILVMPIGTMIDGVPFRSRITNSKTQNSKTFYFTFSAWM
jgi:hypothetical protein